MCCIFQLLPLEEPILDKGVLLSLQSALNCGQKKVGLAPESCSESVFVVKKENVMLTSHPVRSSWTCIDVLERL